MVIKKFIALAALAVASVQPAYAAEPTYSPIELELIKTAYSFGFCHDWVPAYDWRDNRANMTVWIDVKILDVYYDKGVKAYDKKGFDYSDRKVCVKTVNQLIEVTNRKLR